MDARHFLHLASQPKRAGADWTSGDTCVLVAGSAIRTKQRMPRHLPEKSKQTRRSPKRFNGSGYGSFTVFQSPPVKEGQELSVVIDDIGSKGDGISRIGGYMIFVSNAKIGERLRVRILEVNRNFAVAVKCSK